MGTCYDAFVMGQPSLRAYYRLDDDTGDFRDSVAGGASGAPTGVVTRNAFGPPTQDSAGSVTFGGADTDAIIVPDQSRLDFGDGPFTLMLWLRRDSLVNTPQTFLNKGTGGYGVGAEVAEDNGRLLLSKIGTAAMVGSAPVADNGWHHYAAVRTATGAGNTLWYLDNVETHVDIAPLNVVVDTAQPLRIGSEIGWAGCSATMAKLALFNAALSPAIIAGAYAARLVSCAGGDSAPWWLMPDIGY